MKNILKDKSYKFALRIVKLSKFLQSEKHEYILSKQILRSGTSVGAMVREAEFSQSKADFINKMSIALKEANETDYWLDLLHDSDFINSAMFESISPEIKELIKILIASINTAKSHLKEEKAKC